MFALHRFNSNNSAVDHEELWQPAWDVRTGAFHKLHRTRGAESGLPLSHNQSPRFLPSERPGRHGHRGTRGPVQRAQAPRRFVSIARRCLSVSLVLTLLDRDSPKGQGTGSAPVTISRTSSPSPDLHRRTIRSPPPPPLHLC